MLGIKTITGWLTPPSTYDEAQQAHDTLPLDVDLENVFEVGSIVFDGAGNIGVIQAIETSPYWSEQQRGIYRATVDGLLGNWRDYWLPGEFEVLS